MDSLDELSKSERKKAKDKLKSFALDEKTSGFSIHSLDRVNCDDSFKSARISRDLRLIFSQQGDKYIFLYVDHHDEAYEWAEGKYLDQNNYGALYVRDVNIKPKELTQDYDDYLSQFDDRVPLLEKQNIKQKDLEKLGIDSEFSEYIMQIKEIDAFITFIDIFPDELAEGLLDLVTGSKSLTEVYTILNDDPVKSGDNIENALRHKDSKRRFYFVKEYDELDYILDENIEKWQLFLHPSQEFAVERDFNGPALIEGGPGTGKTVVGMHRAVYLANNTFNKPNSKILFVTFSKKLANYIDDKLNILIKQKKAPEIIDVKGVDSFIYMLINQYNLIDNKKCSPKEITNVMEDLYYELNLDYNFQFFETEYEEVIQRYNIKTEKDYLDVTRLGRNRSIHPSKRKEIWNFFNELLKRKNQYDLIDYEDRAHVVENAIDRGLIKPMYDSVIIDEAQDLSPVKIRIFDKLTKVNSNNLFLLSDKNQRIYKLDSWKKDIGINIVGRTHYLTLNYRTTKQIREYADSQFVETEQDKEYLKEYKSIYLGPQPIIKSFANNNDQSSYIIKMIKKYLEKDVKPYEICVINMGYRKELKGILEHNDIEVSELEDEIYPKPGNGVGLSSFHGAKGLEFKIVFLSNYESVDNYLKNEYEDKWFNQQKLKQIECLKYVACTRARDELIITYLDN